MEIATKQQRKEQIEQLLESYEIDDKKPISTLLKDACNLVDENSVRIILNSVIRKAQAAIRTRKYFEEISQPIVHRAFTFEQMKTAFVRCYLAQENREFQIDKYSKRVIKTLCLYFTNDERFEQIDPSYSLSKGILLQGPIGSGKTSLLKVFMSNQKQSFRIVSSSEITREFSESGYKGIAKYLDMGKNMRSQMFYGQEHVGWLFDDLGVEKEGQHFGKKSNIMTELLMELYNKSETKGAIHVTTNLSAENIEEVYGKRLRSRMREMFNVISYDVEAPDRRR